MTDPNKILCKGSSNEVFHDRIEIQSRRIIYFKDIKSILAIPCHFLSTHLSEEADVHYYLELIIQNGRKIMVNECEYSLIEAFQNYKRVKIDYMLTIDHVLCKYSKSRYILSSLLFELSPLRIELWKDPGDQTIR